MFFTKIKAATVFDLVVFSRKASENQEDIHRNLSLGTKFLMLIFVYKFYNNVKLHPQEVYNKSCLVSSVLRSISCIHHH